jgi:acetolactate synthase-1/2/3 large subunit
MPEAVPIAHETIAVAMAHGFYLMTGRPQAVMVHVNVGTANALMGLINASRDNVPMLFTSGRTPLTERGLLGSRDLPIHWGQEMFDQGGMLRELVKLGLRAARADAARGHGRSRAGHRHERATRTNLSFFAA